MKRWSKLQRDVYKIIDPKLNLQIHCRAYRMPNSQSTRPQIPRYWITLNEEIIFDIPKDLKKEKIKLYEHIPNISQLLRDYINSPIENLVSKEFNDDYGIINILKAADRRIGKRQWNKLPNIYPINKILEFRNEP